jgi:hypothetical protein
VEVQNDGTGIQSTVPATGLNNPLGVAVDGLGDVYIADSDNSRVVEVSANGTQTTVGTGLVFPIGLAVDAAGDVFIADDGNNDVVDVSPNGTQTTVGTGLNEPFSVALDGAGDLFIANYGTNQVLEVQRSQPPVLSFGSTTVGQTSALQSVTAQNIGNKSLTMSETSESANFEQVPGSGTPEPCPAVLSPGTSCNLNIVFTPATTGSISGLATLTDNTQNSTATQSIHLAGTGVQP